MLVHKSSIVFPLLAKRIGGEQLKLLDCVTWYSLQGGQLILPACTSLDSLQATHILQVLFLS